MSKRTDFLKDVEHEIRSLKENATKEELGRLDLQHFDPNYPTDCLYGQMTNSCESLRAKELMDKSCIRIMDLSEYGTDDIYQKDIEDPDFKINGKYNAQTWEESSGRKRSYQYLSALEGYICTKNANIAGIIAFLRDDAEFPVL